jgi:hypothetical protein
MLTPRNTVAGSIIGLKTHTSRFEDERDIKTLQKFASVHASTHNHFNLGRHLNSRDVFKKARSAALAEWRQLAA